MRTNSKTKPSVDFDDLLGLEPVVAAIEPPQNLPRLANERDLAAFWGVSSRQVRMLLSERVIEKVEGGLFDRTSATQAYLRRLIEQASRRASNDPELRAEKLRIAREQADQLELKNAAARGELVSASSVKTTWADLLRDVRAGLLAVSSRVGARLPALTPHELSEIDSEIRAVLKEVSDDDHA